MESPTRRGFLVIAGTGAASAGAVAMASSSLAATVSGLQGSTAGAPAAETTSGRPIVAWIEDASSGQISVMSGESAVVVTDRGLVASIARLAESAGA